MPLIKDDRIVDDPWVTLGDEQALPGNAWPIVSLERWQGEREALMDAGVPLGLRLRSDQPPRLVAEDVQHFAVIALEFPKFTDGRPYSSARLLRERYGYAGELRAVGHVLRDQALFMVRCGFDAFEVADGTPLEAWRAALARISVWYQPAADGRTPVPRLRRAVSVPAAPSAPPQRSSAESCAACWAY
ncbi:MAG: DUF934 domain-containing protein [Kiloniellaceae bacterium]